MNRLSLYAIVIFLSFLAGCSAVYSTKPVGLATKGNGQGVVAEILH